MQESTDVGVVVSLITDELNFSANTTTYVVSAAEPSISHYTFCKYNSSKHNEVTIFYLHTSCSLLACKPSNCIFLQTLVSQLQDVLFGSR